MSISIYLKPAEIIEIERGMNCISGLRLKPLSFCPFKGGLMPDVEGFNLLV